MKVSDHRRNYRDVSGTTINNIKVVCDDGTRTTGGNVMWLCECYCGATFYTRLARLRDKQTKSCGCYRKQRSSEAQRARIGPKHPNWNPSLTDEDRAAKRDTQQDADWRKAVYERDGYKCVVCGGGAGKLNAHHLEGYACCVEKRHDLDNGVTLCEDHHKEFHKIYGKGNNTTSQFLDFVKD